MGMKKAFSTIGVVVAIALLTCMASSAAADSAIIEVIGIPESGILELEVGETVTFDIQVTSDTQFILAMAMPDIYYPGRAVSWHGNDIAKRADSATLHLTMTGKGSTADFAEVCGWPDLETEPECWPAGMDPASIVVGVRYQNNVVVSERFNFAVVVP
jgi:hypothetical protein